MASTTYVVTAPLVVVPDESGRDLYLYKGTEVPGNADSDRVKQLVEEGMIASAKAAEKELAEQPADVQAESAKSK